MLLTGEREEEGEEGDGRGEKWWSTSKRVVRVVRVVG